MSAAVEKLKVYIVEDEADLRDEIVEALNEAGFSVNGFPGSRELYAAMLGAPCDVVILDINLPGEDGFTIAEYLHKLGIAIGIIMLTARTQAEDRVRALLGGADAYLTKPVNLSELIAAIHSLSRRLNQRRTPTAQSGEWSLSNDGWTLTTPQHQPLHLTSQERLFMRCLWEKAGENISRDVLINALGENPYDYDPHRLDTLVNRLRRKAQNAGSPLPLRAIRGHGYVLTTHFAQKDNEMGLSGK